MSVGRTTLPFAGEASNSIAATFAVAGRPPADGDALIETDADLGRSRRLPWILGAAVLVAGLAAFCPIAYGANDDSGILLSLAVTVDERKDPLLTPLAPSFAVALGWLYNRAPNVPWYGLSLAIGNAVALGLFLHALRRAPRIAVLIAAAPLAALFADALFWWTFTKTMLLLQFAAFLQIFAWLQGPEGRKFPYATVIGSLLAGYCFRYYFFLNTLAFAAPVLLFARPNRVRPLLATAAIVAAAIFGDGKLRQRLVDEDEGYRSYSAFHNVRYRFHDMPEGYPNPHTEAALAKAGWTADDMTFFRKLWGIYDDAKFNEKTLAAFLEENKKGLALGEVVKDPTESPWLQVMHDSAKKNGPFLAASAVPGLALLWLLAVSPKPHRWRTAAAVLVQAGLISFLFVTRLPIRVGVPVFAYSFALGALLLAGRHVSDRFGRFLPAALAACVIGTWWAAFEFGDTIRDYAESNREYRTFLESAAAATKGRAIVVTDPTQALSPEMIHPLREEREFDRGLVVLPCGTKVNSPLYKRWLAARGWSSGRAMLEDAVRGGPVVFFSYCDKPETLPLWSKHLERLAPGGKTGIEFETLAERTFGKTGRMALLKIKSNEPSKPLDGGGEKP